MLGGGLVVILAYAMSVLIDSCSGKSGKSTNTAWDFKKENSLRAQLSSAPSLEECGLDSSLYGEGLHVLTPRRSTKESSLSTAGLPMPGLTNDSLPRRETFVDEAEVLSFRRRKKNRPLDLQNSQIDDDTGVVISGGYLGNGMTAAHRNYSSGSSGKKGGEDDFLVTPGGNVNEREKDNATVITSSNSRFKDPSLRLRSSGLRQSTSIPSMHYHHSRSSISSPSHNEAFRARVSGGIELDEGGRPLISIPSGVQEEYEGPFSSTEMESEANLLLQEGEFDRASDDSASSPSSGKSTTEVNSQLVPRGRRNISEIEEVINAEELPLSSSPVAADASSSGGVMKKGLAERPRSPITIPSPRQNKNVSPSPSVVNSSNGGGMETSPVTKECSPCANKSSSKPPLVPSSPRLPRTDSSSSSVSDSSQLDASAEARRRWRRVGHTLLFARHMSSVRASASEFLEHAGPDSLSSGYHVRSDAGRAGAAAFEGARTRALGARARAKGRKGMEGMLVRQDKGLVTLVQDFYVACLKLPFLHFLIGVFVAPIALGLLFTPLYLFDKPGLALDGVPLADEHSVVGKVAVAKQKVSALLNVFLYALSLSTTFGGSPVNAVSPFCLVVANINTLMGQFLFVFLSGAVFARMSQPSLPVRCSKKAIIRVDDFTPVPDDIKEKNKVFAVRLVLTGPPPCELVGAKICLTFRIFIKLPSGSMFCSTQDLELVRPEVPYLRYGIMVRHNIDKRSPLYGHTMETLSDGDASFSLTISGQERTSMQPIFHLEDYFVCDGDVAWDGDYVDFIHINNAGERVLDHSKIDELHISKETKFGSGGSTLSVPPIKIPEKDKEKEKEVEGLTSPGPLKGWSASSLRGRKIWSSKSTSFTRADW
ncbi:hypothetical protein R1sor_025740 [Riccia sorocarpa]|uniref:Inward rectifier potassium channel C-terminal domain-containing protein n=1 Tax=Riccia sorocarpa TaxID=122646 RepID=A0ABD3GB28_9MARC